MRILHITPSFYPAVGGVETHVARVAQQLSSRGHDVTVLTQADQPGEETIGAVRVVRLSLRRWYSSWLAAKPYLSQADVVQCHDAYSFLHFYMPSCWLPPRRPVFVTFHGYESYPLRKEALQKRRFVRKHVRDALCMGEFICEWYGTKCFAVSYGGADPVSNPPPLPDQPAALFVGRLAEDTSLLLYLDALVILRKDYNRRLPLTIAGDGPLRPLAEKYAKAQGLDVTFLGTVADPAPLFARASIAFVSGYLAIWQALANGRQVFSLYDNALKGDYLRCFPESPTVIVMTNDTSILAEQLNAHLGNASLGKEMRERGLRLASEHTWNRVADLYLAMYTKHGIR